MVHLGCWWKRHVNLSTVCFRLKIFAGRATSSYFAICQYSKMKTMKGSVQTRMLHCSSRGSCYCKKCTGKEQRTGELNTLGLSNCDYFWARRADYLWNTAVRSRYSGFCVCLWLADLKTWWTGRARHPKKFPIDTSDDLVMNLLDGSLLEIIGYLHTCNICDALLELCQ